MEGMMHDLTIGKDHQKEFVEHVKGSDADLGPIDFTVQVRSSLSYGHMIIR
jgi:hypothetical protein